MPADSVIYVDTAEGAALFDAADIKGHFWTLCRFFVSEKFLTYCGIAASVTTLNSLGIDAPDDPQLYPYKIFTQDNIFTDAVLHRRRPLEVEKGGNSLEQLATILTALQVPVATYFTETLSINEFRQLLVQALSSPEQRVIVDFDRQALQQKGHGHFSPLAAYHSGTDRFLLMDVARYKYPPCWVSSEMLWSACQTIDPTSTRSRGVLIVGNLD